MATIAMMGSANAAIFVVSNVVDGVSETLYANSQSLLLTSGVATIGYFPDGFVINTSNIPNLITNFTIVSTGVIGGPSADLGGSFAGYAQSDPVDVGAITGPPLLGRPVYSFMGNAASLVASDAFALIQVASILTDAAATNTYTSNPGLAVPIIGTIGSFTGNAGGQGSATYRTLNLVPEPSAALLGALGALGLLRRRRI